MLQIYYPFKPFVVTQKWGNESTAYSTQFNNPDFKLHNGIDANTGRLSWDGKVLTSYPVYCPVEGFTVHKVNYSPNGGGHEVWLLSDEPVEMFERKAYAQLVMCHAEKILVKPGDKPKLGELIMIADNTGFSTGLHTHIGLYRVDYNGYSITKIDKNSAEGSFDPSLFMTGEFAIDKASLSTLITSGMRHYFYLLAK